MPRLEAARPRGLLDDREAMIYGPLSHRLSILSAGLDRQARELRELYEQLPFVAVDDLTHLPGRPALDRCLDECMARRVPLALTLLDLDGFKRCNDTLGHAAGDEVLTVVAGALASSIRAGDLAARIGGDEFAVVLVGAQSCLLAERVLGAVLGAASHWGVACSAGVTLWRAGDRETRVQLIARADAGLYVAKAARTGLVEAA